MLELSVEAIQHNLKTAQFGQTAIYYSQLDSTNTEMKKMAGVNAPEGTLIVTDEQTAGRGRLGRKWFAPPQSSLLTSLLFRPTFLPPQKAQTLTMLCALAASEAISTQTGIQVDLKWPNDLIYKGQKLAGFLTELSFEDKKLAWAIVGMGLNVNVDTQVFTNSQQISEGYPVTVNATSLQIIGGKTVPRLPLLQAYLMTIEKHYNALKAGNSPYALWAKKLVTIGKQVTVFGVGVAFQGVAEKVDEEGALLIRLPNGHLERILAGDVTLQKS